jgi:hypothetical protein
VLNENHPNRDDSWLADETAAAMRDFARTVTEAPPLRLAAGFSPAGAPRRVRGVRRWWTWMAPVTAAAVVVVLAIALVVVKDIPNGAAVPSSTSTSTTTGPDGAPRYYVALKKVSGNTGDDTQQDGIVVGDSLTGTTLATFAPPARTTFESVTAAADDRTFAVEAITSSNGKWGFPFDKGATLTASWFEVQLAPDTAHPARLIPLPIKPWSWAGQQSVHDVIIPSPGEIFATALSASGQELAVADISPVPAGDLTTAQNWQEVKVFSLATGRLLHDWTEHDPSAAFTFPQGLGMTPSLTWIDGDQALLFTTAHEAQPSLTVTGTVRRLNVAGPASGNLMTDSAVVWSGELTYNEQYGCFAVDHWPPLISADAKTVSCTNIVGTVESGLQITFDTDPLPAGTAAGLKPGLDYQVTTSSTKEVLGNVGLTSVLWVSPSGDTLIGAWSFGGSSPDDASAQHIGVISHGKFTPLRLPSDILLGLSGGVEITAIVW